MRVVENPKAVKSAGTGSSLPGVPTMLQPVKEVTAVPKEEEGGEQEAVEVAVEAVAAAAERKSQDLPEISGYHGR